VRDSPVGPLSLLTVKGRGDIDVCLAIADEQQAAGAVLLGAMDAANGAFEQIKGSSLPVGAAYPGLRVEEAYAAEGPVLFVAMPRFSIQASHDLMNFAEVFGLGTARDRTAGHFPGISPMPLAVNKAAQDATVTFSAEGFKAAAVTVVEVMIGAAREGRDLAPWIDMRFDRPFGFVARHRPTGLITFAGWVAEVEDNPLPFGLRSGDLRRRSS
jgi:Serpin (serine protease inhibitor)